MWSKEKLNPGPPCSSFYSHSKLISGKNLTDLILKNGVTISAGTVVAILVPLLQMDNSSCGQDWKPAFKNPRTGAVEEHADSGESSFVLNEPIDNAAFLSFGSGTRACIGQNLAIHGVATLLAYLIEKYEIWPESGLNNDLKPATNNRFLPLLRSRKIIFVRRMG